MSSQSLVDLHGISSSYVTLGSTLSHIHNFHPTSSCQYCVYCVEVTYIVCWHYASCSDMCLVYL